MKQSIYLALASLLIGVAHKAYADDNQSVQENTITVTAELQENNLYQLPASISVIGQETIEQNNAQHISELFNLAPNVNFSTGASRGRFIQIRGIGERSQFIEPINPSVGVILDGIDMTGISLGTTTLDVKQVEILRGPQGTLYGANALAGLINVVSNDPTENFYSKVTATLEDYQGYGLTATVSDALSEKFGYRLSVGHYQSDGYMENIFLNRSDTNNINEGNFKAKFFHQANNNTKVNTTLLFTNIDNGYDAFSLDINRNTYSDQPGHDRQQTRAASWIVDHKINDIYSVKATLSFANSDVEYGFDEDWSYIDFCNDIDCLGTFYTGRDNYNRRNNNESLDILLRSNNPNNNLNWSAGLYARNQRTDLDRQHLVFFGPDQYGSPITSQFDTQNLAVYGQLNYQINEKLRLESGIRLEERTADYSDSNNIAFAPDDNFIGGKVGLTYVLSPSNIFYGLISRGYKPSGVNRDGTLSAEQRSFDSEFLVNYEAGFKTYLPENALSLQTSIFYQDRKDAQVNQAIQVGTEFIQFLDNAPKAKNYGVELEMAWSPTDLVSLYSTIGLLKTEFIDFNSFAHELASQDAPIMPYSLNGRSQAHAPEYQFVLGTKIYLSENWTFNPEIQGKDEFFFSNSHESKSDAYEIINLRINYELDEVKVSFYVNNLTDKDIKTRGFRFGNNPRNGYATESYYQFAAPRVIGLSASMTFN